MTTLTRRALLAASGSALYGGPAVSGVLIGNDEATRIRETLGADARAMVERRASAALTAGPWSVTFHRPSGTGVDASVNDYYSEGPYWWPDPANPTGPYIRKDGERNPARFQANRNDLGALCEAVLSLGMGACFRGRSDCGAHAGRLLTTWFLDPKTRMNPNLEFGQAVRGRNTGRGTGLIDTVSLIHLVQGAALLELAGALDAPVAAGLRQWFRDFLRWMTTSRKGLEEKKSGNNHATWWTAQVAAYAFFTGDAAARRMAWEHYRNYLVPSEIRPDGSCPREEARTQSLSYSSMNLDAFAVICRLAARDGVDLWKAVETSFRYLLPFVLHPETWTKPQITKFNPGQVIFPGLGGVGLRAPDLLSAYRQLPRSNAAWVQFVDLLVKVA